jgi:hypothetical protein
MNEQKVKLSRRDEISYVWNLNHISGVIREATQDLDYLRHDLEYIQAYVHVDGQQKKIKWTQFLSEDDLQQIRQLIIRAIENMKETLVNQLSQVAQSYANSEPIKEDDAQLFRRDNSHD